MRKILIPLLMLMITQVKAQQTENVIIITTDGFRWQELFGGLDTGVVSAMRIKGKDSAHIYQQYWSADVNERRKKLLPFFWSTISSKGQLYGNRNKGNLVNVSNPYWFSYPGYSEIMCGYVDDSINSNDYKPNPNTTLTAFFNKQPKLKGKVAAFGAWNAFDRILNERESGVPVFSAYDNIGGQNPNAQEKLINAMLQDSHRQWHEDECFDVFTHYGALEYLKKNQPKVLYIAYGETDEWAHAGNYSAYLDAAHRVDAWIRQLWETVQSMPQYRNKTTLFITTDHGRGDKQKNKWTSHGASVEGASEIWFAALGPGIKASGEMGAGTQYYQKQFAQTIAQLMGYKFKAEHPVADEIKSVTGR